MSERIAVKALGGVIEIDASAVDEGMRERIRTAWTDAITEDEKAADATVVVRTDVDERVELSRLSTAVTLAALTHRQGEMWMLHAAGLADKDGTVIAFVAASGTGKTTLSRRLSSRYAYVSDESVGIALDGTIETYRKPLSIIEKGEAVKTQTPISQLVDALPVPDALRLGRIVVLDRSDSYSSTPEVIELGLAEAFEALAPQTSHMCELPQPLSTMRELIESSGGVVRLKFRDGADADPVVDELFAEASQRATRAGAASHACETDEQGATALTEGEALAESGYRRAEIVDMIDIENGCLAVLQRSPRGGSLIVLDGIAPAIVRAATGVTIDELEQAVRAEVGEPPAGVDAVKLVRTAAQELVDKGILLD